MAKKTARRQRTARKKTGSPSRTRRPRTAAPVSRKVIRVVLPPSEPAGQIKCGHDLKWAGITVGADGVLTVPPTLLQLCTGDIVTWLVNNQSGRPLSLRLKEFQRKATGRPFSPIRWIQDEMTVTHGSVGTISGEVIHLPGKDTEVEHVKYTIEVRGPGAIDYDPDLEIRRPPM